MKNDFFTRLALMMLLIIPASISAQAPDLGSTSSFALFTAVGAFNNLGTSNVTGDIGTNVGQFTGFPPGIVAGQIHVTDPTSVQAAIDVDVAYTELSGTTCTAVIGTTLGNGQVVGPNVYCIGAATTLNGTLVLDGQGDPNSKFIFKIDGAFSTSTFANVNLINSASLCNVYWQVNGAFNLSEGSVFRGTVVANGAISLLEGAALYGRAITREGLIELHNNIVALGDDPIASVISANGNISFCAGGSVTLQGNVGGVWSNGSNNSSITVNSSGNYSVTNTASCGSVTSNHIVVTVGAQPVASSITANGSLTFCTGNNVVLSGNVGGTWSTGATTPTINVSTSGNYSVTNTNSCGTVTSNHIITTLITSPIISVQPEPLTLCSGASAIFEVTASGSGLAYQWRIGTVNLVNGAGISGATTAILTINAADVTNAATNYNVLITGTCLPAIASANVALNVNSQPAITTQPVNQVACTNGDASFHFVATGSGLSYQWRKGLANLVNGGNISGATSSTLNINPVGVADAGSNYNVVITGTCVPQVISSNASLIINTTLVINSQPGNQNTCLGESASFTVSATGGGLTYQWRKGTVNLTNGGAISGATSATLTINPVAAINVANNYNVVITGACATTVTSSNAALTSIIPVSITSQPTTQTICAGNTVSFSVNAIGTGLTYQWRKGTTDLVNGGNISGATSATLTINPATIADAGANYNVEISGTCLANSTSNNVALVIQSGPAITAQPVNDIACTGGTANFSVIATGTGLTYQWRKGTVNLVNGGNISGATSANLVINPVVAGDAANNYNVRITGTCTPVVTSSNVSLVINSTLVINTQPVNQNACLGDSVSFTVAASGGGLTYQWRKGTVNLTNGAAISGATSATLTINASAVIDAATNYNVVISGSCATTVTSANASLIINTNVVISVQPTPITVCTGGIATFSVSASGSGLTYQWRKGNVNLVNGGNISGANSATLSINPAGTINAATNYNVVVGSSCGTNVTSANVSLIVNGVVVIITQPIDQTACLGASVSFAVLASGTGLQYHWKKGNTLLTNGGDISGALSSTLTINNVSLADAANYSVELSGICPASVISNLAALTVNAKPVIVTAPKSAMAEDGSSISFSVVATGTALSYQWRNGTVNLVNGLNISGANTDTLTISPVSIADSSSNYNVVVTGLCSPAAISVDFSLFVCVCVITPVFSATEVDNNKSLSVFPNPFNAYIDIVINSEVKLSNAALILYNALGVVVASYNITKHLTTIDTESLAAGVYFYKVTNNYTHLQSGKIVARK